MSSTIPGGVEIDLNGLLDLQWWISNPCCIFESWFVIQAIAPLPLCFGSSFFDPQPFRCFSSSTGTPSDSNFSKKLFPGHAAASLHLRSSSLHIGAVGGECFLLALGRDAQGLDEGKGCGNVEAWNLCYYPSWNYEINGSHLRTWYPKKESTFLTMNFQVLSRLATWFVLVVKSWDEVGKTILNTDHETVGKL